MKRIEFTKVVASGNDFVVIRKSHMSTVTGLRPLVKNICDRKFGVGADGVLILEKSKAADIKMRIFNADGSEAEMCGNGARCTALYISRRPQAAGRRPKLQIETKAGIIEAKITGDKARIKLTDPADYQPGIPIKINDRELKISSINTGVPHAIIFVEGIENIDVSNLGRQIRYYESFAPAGTNVDFVEVINDMTIKARTYERGVEDETLACGTGAVAAAIVTVYACLPARRGVRGTGYKNKINVITRGAETLKVYFNRENDKITNVWLEGKVKIVYRGEYYV